MKLKLRSLIILPIVAALYVIPAAAQQDTFYGYEEFRDRMVDLLFDIETVTGQENGASNAFAEASPEVMEEIYKNWVGKKHFFSTSQQINSQIESSKDRFAEEQLLAAQKLPEIPQQSATTVPAIPDYPYSGNSASFVILKTLGFIGYMGQRCGGDLFMYYEGAIIGANITTIITDAACSVAGCDPTGIGCAVVCIADKVLALAVQTMAAPIEHCKNLDGNIDSAEISADYLNGVSILNDVGEQDELLEGIIEALADHDSDVFSFLSNHDLYLRNHDTRVTNQLSAHDLRLQAQLSDHDTQVKTQLSTHDTDIKARLDNVVANQLEIIKLLKTPEGKRPGFPKEGY